MAADPNFVGNQVSHRKSSSSNFKSSTLGRRANNQRKSSGSTIHMKEMKKKALKNNEDGSRKPINRAKPISKKSSVNDDITSQ